MSSDSFFGKEIVSKISGMKNLKSFGAKNPWNLWEFRAILIGEFFFEYKMWDGVPQPFSETENLAKSLQFNKNNYKGIFT